MPPRRTSASEEATLAARIRAGDLAARDELVQRNLLLVYHLANNIRANTDLDFDDLVQEGTLGLLAAATRYDPARGTRFGTYAAFWVKRNMTMGCVYRSHHMDTPYRHRSRRHSPPTATEVLSMDRPLVRGEVGATFADQLVDARGDEATAQWEMVRTVGQLLAVAGLTPREAHILREKFWGQRTLADVGQDLGISRERVRQLQEGALRKMRAHLRSHTRTCAL